MRKIMWFVCFCRMLLCHKMGYQITKIKRNMFPPPARPLYQSRPVRTLDQPSLQRSHGESHAKSKRGRDRLRQALLQ